MDIYRGKELDMKTRLYVETCGNVFLWNIPGLPICCRRFVVFQNYHESSDEFHQERAERH